MLWQKKMWLLAFLALCPHADADTVVRFRFTAVGPGNSVFGGGNFSFADGLTTVGLGDLKGFFFTASVFDDIHGGPQYYDYEQPALRALSATFDLGPTGPTLTSLSLSTTPQQQPDDPLFPELAFNVASLATGGAFMERWKSGVDEGAYAVGAVSAVEIDTGVAPVPEPSGAVTLGLGALGVGLARRRRRAAG